MKEKREHLKQEARQLLKELEEFESERKSVDETFLKKKTSL
jgi:hypothetical protein